MEKDHPKSQVIGETYASILTRAQQKEQKALLNVNQEFCMFNSFISKIQTKTVKADLDHSDWVEAM